MNRFLQHVIPAWQRALPLPDHIWIAILLEIEVATIHYNKHMDRCPCKEETHGSCRLRASLQLSLSFAALEQTARSNTVRAMLLPLTAPAGSANELSEWDSQRAQSRKIKRRRGERENVTIKYALRGQRLCMEAFAAVTQTSRQTILKLARDVTNAQEFRMYSTERSKSKSGKLSLQTTAAVIILRKYAELNAMACPTGRGSQDDEPLRVLSSDTRRSKVYQAYVSCWDRVFDALITHGSGSQQPSGPLCFKSFLRVWGEYYPTCKISKSGSDFCDTCTTLSHLMENTQDNIAKEAISNAREKHRAEASAEFAKYKSMQEFAKLSPDNGSVQLTFDFAEKVLLPSLIRQPGQLHFVTGLKFDIFGLACSNLDCVYVFGLTEGYWPNHKTANETMSMVHYTLQLHRVPSLPTANYNTIDLHCDNCAGQNKNRFVLWYLAWRVLMDYEDCVTLYFLVAGHTKNRCDGAFGLVKRSLKQHDVNHPTEMMRIIEDSATSNHVVCSTALVWWD